MIFVLIPLAALVLWNYARVVRERGLRALAGDVIRALIAGLLAGLVMALAARLGMRLIAIANDAAPRISWRGTSVVLTVYSGLGSLVALLYGAVFRAWLKRSGLGFGGLIFLATWYPLAHSGAQQLTVPMPWLTFVGWSGAVVALMWLPYGLLLEWLFQAMDRRDPAIVRPIFPEPC